MEPTSIFFRQKKMWKIVLFFLNRKILPKLLCKKLIIKALQKHSF